MAAVAAAVSAAVVVQVLAEAQLPVRALLQDERELPVLGPPALAQVPVRA